MKCIRIALKSVRPDYSVIIMKAKVSEAGSLTAPARLAIAQAFNEGKLSTATTNTTLDLPLPAATTSKYVTSVTAVGTSELIGTVTAVMQGTNNTAIDGRQSSTRLHVSLLHSAAPLSAAKYQQNTCRKRNIVSLYQDMNLHVLKIKAGPFTEGPVFLFAKD
jgi:hypothetical protein